MDTSAAATASRVRTGELDPVDVVGAAFHRLERAEPRIGAFAALRREAAEAEARAVREHPDRAALPLAGVPVAVKDDVDVAGLPTRKGSLATSPEPATRDDAITRRLREAGAVVVGKTAVPELMAVGATESLASGATRNPWDLSRTPGGSSGGSAAAVAAGVVPLAIGSDGLGSIRIPSGCCGVVGMKPGPGVVPHPAGASTWLGMSEHGPIAATVADVALLLDVLAGVEHRGVGPPPRPSRIALSLRSFAGLPPASDVVRAVRDVAGALAASGHTVVERDPPYPADLGVRIVRRWVAGLADDARDLPLDELERGTRGAVRAGRVLQRLAPTEEADTDDLRARYDAWFADVDVLLTPTLMRSPMRVGTLHGRGWWRGVAIQSWYYGHPPVWNLVGYPAASVPAGRARDGSPLGAQLVAPRGGERLLLALAARIEALRPWPRTAGVAGPG